MVRMSSLLAALAVLHVAHTALATDGVCPVMDASAVSPLLALSGVDITTAVGVGMVITAGAAVDSSVYDNITYVLESDGEVLGSPAPLNLATSESGLLVPARTFTVMIPGLPLRWGGYDLTLSLVGLPEDCYTAENPQEVQIHVDTIWSVLSILPPVTTITLAILTRNGVVSLAGGVWIGATLVNGFNPITGWLRMLDTYVVNSMSDSSNASIILISFFITGMVAIIAKSGGAAGVASLVTHFARDSRKGQIAAWCTGLCLFFDDYANILVNGNAFRPIAAKLRISRAKLAFIVDCSAAAFASIMPVSTWISFEVGLIQEELKIIREKEILVGGDYIQTEAYLLFLQSVPYSFYQLMILAFSLMIAVTSRDFGPMAETETRARSGLDEQNKEEESPENEEDQAETRPKPGVLPQARNGFIPILSVVLSLIIGLFWTGTNNALAAGDELNLPNIIGNAESYNVLLWSGMMGLLVPMVSLKIQNIMDPLETLQVWFHGMRALIEPLFVLLGAWSLGTVVKELQLPAFVIQVLGGAIDPGLLPTIVFLIACVIAFSTGTSFGTMAVMFPLVIPLIWELTAGVDLEMRETKVIQGIGAILAGAIFGDHCSPISDTTILSAIATGCQPTEHVRTQLPYAGIAAAVAILCGYLPTGFFNNNAFVSLIVGWIALLLITFVFGTKVQPYEPVTTTNLELGEALNEKRNTKQKLNDAS